MSFDHKLFQNDLISHLKNRLGWSEPACQEAAKIASDVICLTHGGFRHYIKTRQVDREKIMHDYNSGVDVATLARRQGLSIKVIKQTIETQD